MTTLARVRRLGAQRLQTAGIESPHTEAELLLSKAAGISRAALVARSSDRADECLLENFMAMVVRRCSREPLQYILGSWEFYGLPLEVRPGVLIPRSDTELLVETALLRLPVGGRFLDWGTGSGCLPLAMLSARDDLTAVAADANPMAVSLAWLNLNSAGLLPRCLLWHSRMPIDIPLSDGELSMIVSNPPYIPSAAMSSLMEEVRAEPRSALEGGEDGLDWYRELFAWGPAKVRPGGWILFEIGDGGQGEKLAEIAPPCLQFKGIFCDLSQKPRAALWLRV